MITLRNTSQDFRVVNRWLLTVLDALNAQYGDLVKFEGPNAWGRVPVYDHAWVHGCPNDPLLMIEPITSLLRTSLVPDLQILCCEWRSLEFFSFRIYELGDRYDPDNTFLVEVDIVDDTIAVLVKLAEL